MISILAAVLAAALSTAPAAAPTSVIDRTFAQGETLDYDLVWLKMTAGTGRMTISSAGDHAWRITSVARSSPGFSRIYRVDDSIETTVARGDFSTQRYVKRIDHRGSEKNEITTVEDGVAIRTRVEKNKTERTKVPRPVLDPVSVIYRLRQVDLTPGKSHKLTLIADGKLYTVDARVTGRETIETPAGKFASVRVEPEMVSGGTVRNERMTIWYSDDERKIPVRIRTEVKFGAITATLRAVSGGVGAIEPEQVANR